MNRQTEAQHLRLIFDRLLLSAKLELAKRIESLAIDFLRGDPGYLRAASAKNDDALVIACIQTLNDSKAQPRMASAATVLRLCIGFRESGEVPADKVATLLLEYANLDQGIDLERHIKKRAEQPQLAAKQPRQKKGPSPEQVGEYFHDRAGQKHSAILVDAACEFDVSLSTISRRLKEFKKLPAVNSDASDVTKLQ